MYNHEPAHYECPFCAVQRAQDSPGRKRNLPGWVFEDERVLCLVPLHFWGQNKGNCLIIPKVHVENIYDLDESLGIDLVRAAKTVAFAMKRAFQCDGVSTRQHNEPAGDQDIWHFHVHVFPRYHGDSLYAAEKLEYPEEERKAYAEVLAQEIARMRGVYEA